MRRAGHWGGPDRFSYAPPGPCAARRRVRGCGHRVHGDAASDGWWGCARRHPGSLASVPAHRHVFRSRCTVQALQVDGPAEVAHTRQNWPRAQASVFETWAGDAVFDRALDPTGWSRRRGSSLLGVRFFPVRHPGEGRLVCARTRPQLAPWHAGGDKYAEMVSGNCIGQRGRMVQMPLQLGGFVGYVGYRGLEMAIDVFHHASRDTKGALFSAQIGDARVRSRLRLCPSLVVFLLRRSRRIVGSCSQSSSSWVCVIHR